MAYIQLNAFDEQFEQSDFVRSQQHAFLYKLVMPGEVLSSNGVRHGDTLQWNLTAARFFLDDFTLEAQSRKLNVWMILIIAGLFITTIIAFAAKRWK